MRIMPLAWLNRRAAGYPLGGALAFTRAIEKRFRDLGGTIRYGARVSRILVEQPPAGQARRAVGIRFDDGTEHRADVVVSAADGRRTIFDMLEGRYLNAIIHGYSETM